MTHKLTDAFCWYEAQAHTESTDAQKYQEIVKWASAARRQNPNAFDALTAWILDDSQWSAEALDENRKLLMEDIIGRFQTQNAQLRTALQALCPDIVNKAVFETLNRFDDELSGNPHDDKLKSAVKQMFADFSSMCSRDLRRQIAGGRTGPTGTEFVEFSAISIF